MQFSDSSNLFLLTWLGWFSRKLRLATRLTLECLSRIACSTTSNVIASRNRRRPSWYSNKIGPPGLFRATLRPEKPRTHSQRGPSPDPYPLSFHPRVRLPSPAFIDE